MNIFFCGVLFLISNQQLVKTRHTKKGNLIQRFRISRCCIWALSVNVCSKLSLFPGANAASCLCVRRRKLVEQLYLPSQTWDRTCPNRRRHLTSHGLDEGSSVSPELEEGRRQVRSTELQGDTMWTGVSDGSSSIMSISVCLRRITNLPGRSDRKVELTFRGQ